LISDSLPHTFQSSNQSEIRNPKSEMAVSAHIVVLCALAVVLRRLSAVMRPPAGLLCRPATVLCSPSALLCLPEVLLQLSEVLLRLPEVLLRLFADVIHRPEVVARCFRVLSCHFSVVFMQSAARLRPLSAAMHGRLRMIDHET